MKLSIVKDDGAVYKDGLSFINLDLSFIPSNVHALQFNDAITKGWIEFCDDSFGTKPSNELITVLPDWAITASVKWDEAKVAYDEALRLAIEKNKLTEEITANV